MKEVVKTLKSFQKLGFKLKQKSLTKNSYNFLCTCTLHLSLVIQITLVVNTF